MAFLPIKCHVKFYETKSVEFCREEKLVEGILDKPREMDLESITSLLKLPSISYELKKHQAEPESTSSCPSVTF